MLSSNGLYYMYLRKSREDVEAERHGQGETLARHEAQLTETARKLNIRVAAIYREIVSGETIAARPEMLRMLNDIEACRPDGVLVTEIPRLARGDTRDQGLVMETFKYAGTHIITPMKIYNPNDEFDEEYAEFGLFMSRREYANIKRRLVNGKIASVKEGKFAGTRVPYGYERYKLLNEKGFSLRIIPEQAQVVRLIYELYLGGAAQSDHKPVGPSAIAGILNDMHIPTQTGNRWQQGVVRSILTNCVYTGKVHWGKRKTVRTMKDGVMTTSHPVQQDYLTAPGRHEAIIDPATWDRVQKQFTQRSKRPSFLDSGLKNSLSGILYCGACGRAMTRRPAGAGEQTDWLLCRTKGCPTCGSSYQLVEERIIAALQLWFKDKPLDAAAGRPSTAATDTCALLESSRAQLTEQLTTLQKQLDNTCTFLETEVYTPELFQTRHSAIIAQINDRKQALADVQKKISSCTEPTSVNELHISNFNDLFSYYHHLIPEDRNALLKQLTARIEYHKTAKSRKRTEGDFRLTIYPRLPGTGPQ